MNPSIVLINLNTSSISFNDTYKQNNSSFLPDLRAFVVYYHLGTRVCQDLTVLSDKFTIVRVSVLIPGSRYVSTMNNRISDKKICLFCSWKTIESARVNAGCIPSDFATGKNGLICSCCQSYSCDTCLTEITNAIHDKEADQWTRQVTTYLKNGEKPRHFKGHCCEYKMQKKLLSSADEDNANCEMYLDGYLHLPEYDLLIDSPFHCVDVHGLGACYDNDQNEKHFDGAYHCVISHECARKLAKFKSDINLKKLAEDCDVEYKMIEFEDPHTTMIKERKKVC